MSQTYLNNHALTLLAQPSAARAPCAKCARIGAASWQSLYAGSDLSNLRLVGSLRQEDIDEPTFAEHHPQGTHGSSPEAPIAPAFFPYNRCDVWQCRICAHAFLRYTEYGGYYLDERIRALDARLIDDTPL
jgi:hypothetical protein